uniref:Uncharacterized protein n=1 Tax=Pristionchus pacificus TaxID=54126 RepID=A0A2A6BIH1_PRIPA|eukprot:PDM65704.1 hypothetical protein PRIPAC_45618 [Pristionchus pacificus]
MLATVCDLMADLPALRSRGGLQCSNEYILRLASAQGQSENLKNSNVHQSVGAEEPVSRKSKMSLEGSCPFCDATSLNEKEGSIKNFVLPLSSRDFAEGEKANLTASVPRDVTVNIERHVRQ